MAENSKVSSLKLRFEIDRSAAAQAEKLIVSMRRDLIAIAQAEKQITPAAAQAGAAMVKANRDAQRSALDLVKANERVSDSFKDAQRAQNLAGQVQSATGGLRGLSSAAGLTGISGGLDVVSDIAGLADELPRLKEGLSSLPQAARAAIDAIGIGNVGMIGGIAAATIAIKLLADETERVKGVTRTQIDAQLEYFRVVSTGTTSSLTKEKEAAAERVKAAQAAADHAKLINEQFERDLTAGLDPVSAALVQINAALGTNSGELIATREAVDAANKELVTAQAQESLYTRALLDGNVAKNDAIIAEAALAAARQKLTDQLADTQISTLVRANNQSSEAANQRLAAIRQEIETTQRFIDAGGLSAEKTAELQNKITLLGQEMVTLNLEVLPLIQAREREAAAIAYQKKQTEELAAAAQSYAQDVQRIEAQALEARQALNERFNQRVIDIAQQAADSAAAALRDLQKQRAELDRDLGRDFEDAERDRQREELDSMIQAAREEEKAQREHLKNLRQIAKEFNRDSTSAVEARDAVALSQAEQKRNDALQDEKQNLDDSRQEKQIAAAQEASDRRVAFERDRADRILKYQRDQADAVAAYQADLALASQKRQQDLQRAAVAYQQDLAALNQKHAQELAIRKQAAAAEIALISQTEAARARIIMQTQAALVAQARQLAISSAYGSAHQGSAGGHVIPFKDGGNAPANRDLLVGERGPEMVRFKQPSRIYSANQTRQMGGGASVSIDITGLDGKRVKAISMQQAIDLVSKVLTQMGAH